MHIFERNTCQDIWVECFRRLLPWNDPCVLKSVMLYDSQGDEQSTEYKENEVLGQLRGVRTLRLLKCVNVLFRDVARCVLMDFKETFLAWIATEDCTVEGVHAGMIVFRLCSGTHDYLCEKIQYVGVGGHWTLCSWLADLEAQCAHLCPEKVSEMAAMKPDREYCALREGIAVELMGRLLISLRFHPSSKTCLDLCVCLLKRFIHIEYSVDLYDHESQMLTLIESEIRLAMKPNFKLMNPHLWNLNTAGIDIDKRRRGNPEWQQTAHKRLDKYVRALCNTWNVLTVMQVDDTPSTNQKWLQRNHRQINWFSVSDHVIHLLELRQIYISLNWLSYSD